MNRLRPFLIVLVSAASLFALGWAARAPYDPPGGETAVLRLSWRLRGEREEKCRPRTEEELAALPVHMRIPEICEGHLVAYRLVVQTDDAAPDTSVVLPAGAKGDRPVYVFQERHLTGGQHHVRITFGREDGKNSALVYDAVLTMAAGQVELITIDAAGHNLVHRSPVSP